MKETDFLGTCPLSKIEYGCYITPINEFYNSYRSLIVGFQSTDLWKESEFDFTEMESTLPNLYIDIKKVDDEGRVWYPSIISVDGKGIVFVVGTNSEDWQWAGIKHIPVLEEEKERFKNPKTHEYAKYKSDSSSMTQFGQDGYIKALDFIGVLD